MNISPLAAPPVPIRAATVILYRQAYRQFQVYLVKRSIKASFMAGKYVFPGGMLDVEDERIKFWIDRLDEGAGRLADRLGRGVSCDRILPFCVAAIRETFEEAGVLLASVENKSDYFYEQLKSRRTAGRLEAGWLKRASISLRLLLSVSSLSCWSHWITPKRMKRRFDTRFFMAAMPKGQACRPDGAETTHGIWVTPAHGLEGNLDGSIPLSPPTVVTLQELLPFATMGQLKTEIVQRHWGEAILPRMVTLNDGAMIVEPWDPEYNHNPIDIDPESLKEKQLPVGEAFSRLWYYRDIWRPVAP